METRNERKRRNKARLGILEADHATQEAKDAFKHKAYEAGEHIPAPILRAIWKCREALKFVKLDIVEITVEDRETKRRHSWRR